MTLSVKQQVMVDFVNFAAEAHSRLSPFTMENDYVYTADKSYFGGVESTPPIMGGSSEQLYTFTPITVAEYEKETGYDLKDDEDARRKSFLGKIFTENDWRWPEYYAMKDDAEVHVSGGFGDAPWAAPMSNTWNEATTNRLKEVGEVRKELAFLGSTVGAAGESYADLDFENGHFIDATGEPIE